MSDHAVGRAAWQVVRLPADAQPTNFGRNAQYGSLLSTTYLAFGGHGATINRINNFRQIISNPCPAGGNKG